MNSIDCSLSIMVARTDIPFMMHTIPHLVKTCNFKFKERVLFVDTAPLGKKFRNRPGIGSLEELRMCCQKLLDANIVDRVVDIDYSKSCRDRLYRKYFGFVLRHTHNYRGYPIWGSIFSLESVDSRYVVHFDSDMLQYQKSNYCWIEHGIELLEQNSEVMFVSPLSGSPTKDGTLKQRGVPYEKNAGFYNFKDFTSRKFLVDRQRLAQMLPLKPQWLSWKRKLASYLTGESALLNWEIMISNRLKETKYLRADLDSHNAWTFHTPDHGSQFIQNLPEIIGKVESGWFPKEQAGDYDLQLELWIDKNLSCYS